ncbi:hypothetical protein CfE428DRAFT_6686 [Chthoniobacter flavus Ellin428]|uniref:Uncharacterized protein n=2 Tax=Chthoniobacter flavus TaxID=191863 RepID=B4DCP5_9BACT|nr:hypothetical protein CfE428DRAFT_6686 [Chthoniobacter flavus Ellin428]
MGFQASHSVSSRLLYTGGYSDAGAIIQILQRLPQSIMGNKAVAARVSGLESELEGALAGGKRVPQLPI